MTAVPTRRAVLSAIAVAPLAIAASSSAAGYHGELDALVAAYRTAWGAHDEACDRVSSIEEEWFPRQNIRPSITVSRIVEVDGREIPFEVPFWKDDLPWLDEHRPDFAVSLREAIAGYEAARKELDEELGLSSAEAERNRLCDALTAAGDAVIAYPVTTIADLATKAEVVEQLGLESESIATLIADMRRMAGAA